MLCAKFAEPQRLTIELSAAQERSQRQTGHSAPTLAKSTIAVGSEPVKMRAQSYGARNLTTKGYWARLSVFERRE